MESDQLSPDIQELEEALKVLRLDSENLDRKAHVINVLADASKANISIRQHLADPKALAALIEIIECNLNDSLETVDEALRCIGNACVDNDGAREVLTSKGFSWAKRCLNGGETNDLTVSTRAAKALYNICLEYEPAQRRCLDDKLHYDLIELCKRTFKWSALGNELFIELLFWVCSQSDTESTALIPLPYAVASDLIHLPELYAQMLAPEDFAILLETCLIFIRDPHLQQHLVSHNEVALVWRMLQMNEQNIASVVGNENDEKLLIPLSISLIWCLSDIAARPDFAASYGLQQDLVMRETLELITGVSPSSPRLATAACQILGNVLWAIPEPSNFVYLVDEEQLHVPVLVTVNSSQDNELVHAATGLLMHLSRPARARETIGNNSAARVALERLCRHEMPQLKQDGIRLLKALGSNCPSNQERFADLADEAMRSSHVDNSAICDAPD